MVGYFQQKFALSETGAKDLCTAIFSHTLLNISFMLPVMLAFAFLDDYVRYLQAGEAVTRSTWFYLIFALCAFMAMLVIAYIDYGNTYTKIYSESASRRIRLAETLKALPMAFFGKKDIADLSATIMEDATRIEEIFSHAVPQLFASIISMLVMTLLMFIYNWQMSLALFWVVPVGFAVFALSKKSMDRGHEMVYCEKRRVTEKIQEGLEMVQEIKCCHQESAYLQELDDQLDKYEKRLISSELVGGTLVNLSHFMLKLGLPSVIFVGAFLLAEGSISLFTYLVFLIVVGRIYDPLIDTVNHLAALLYLDVRIKRMKDMDSMPRQTGRTDFHPEGYDIEFKDVSFSYQQGQSVVNHVSFVAKQGDVTALIGPSGSGKTTTARLAARFWDIDSGIIMLGGENIAYINPETLLRCFSIVFQDVTLFNASVMENIRLGRKDATDDEVRQAACLAQCGDFIGRLTDGYNTVIGENGERLSGGERQRISIARALLKNAPVILLDEATASLDAHNESKIQQAISELIKDKTVLIIAHRMRTVVAADQIIAMQAGRIVESGSPEKLGKSDGMFASMLKNQAAPGQAVKWPDCFFQPSLNVIK
ncbi:MAG: ABC transporter ATP-binding protein [Proteobacteria bacterium]|nr:MAG: ABC transporter ATP-binding protein [Pseudomonadota bacterium]